MYSTRCNRICFSKRIGHPYTRQNVPCWFVTLGGQKVSHKMQHVFQ
uniref:Uncharacterized protein n=1 Tax=Anguilla anguilla TaxID=7936 RepID=A0A0E9T5P4_ANGAN